eukprot:SAG11_NODE_2790_length_2969_cov_1.817073_3_plen_32_part_00
MRGLGFIYERDAAKANLSRATSEANGRKACG